MEIKSHKYEIVLEFIKEQILNKQITQGDKILSENELALKFGLSRFTVRHAIDILTNEGLVEKHHGIGTFVKIGHTGKKSSHVVGVITTYLDDYIFPNIINGIDTVLSQNGFTISLGITYNKTEKELLCLKSMLQNDVDGLIIEGTKSALPNVNINIINAFKKKDIPIIFINGIYSDVDCSYVVMDDEKGGMLATAHLLNNGHTKIGGIFKLDDIQGHKRYKGFVNSMRQNEIAINENAILWYSTEDVENIFSKDYDKIFIKYFEDCTAIICYNDQIAVKTIEVLERNGKLIPEDISIISFDNSYLAEISSVKLSSISHVGNVMGETAANALLGVMSGKKQVKLKLSSKLVERNSVKNIK
jgi:GntR family transcriptional regulator of arabinose operon